jgi:p90 ribosomal S6 kinase
MCFHYLREFFTFAAVVSDEAFYFDPTFTSKTPKDSPGVPPSATAHELFRGFSYIAPTLLDTSGGSLVASVSPPIALSSATKKTSPLAGLPVKTSPFLNEYELKEKIGFGSCSVCHRCVHRSTHQEYAVKIIEKNVRDCRDEIEILLRYGKMSSLHSM